VFSIANSCEITAALPIPGRVFAQNLTLRQSHTPENNASTFEFGHA
jgi:hypothetical protein